MVSRWRNQFENAALILELDLGNTRAKWRVVKKQGGVVVRGATDIGELLRRRFPDSWRAGIEFVRIASVLAPTIENELIAKIAAELAVPSQLARSTASCGDVINAYANPERLGVDRWLALIAAYKKCGEAVLVVDAGTAFKVDAVNDAGHHIGGYIIPGASLMEGALLNGTDRVRFEAERSGESVMLGRDTRSCVQHGVTAALVGAVMVAIGQSRAIINKQPHVYITGGLGDCLKKHLEEAGVRDINFELDLVMDGLCWALPE